MQLGSWTSRQSGIRVSATEMTCFASGINSNLGDRTGNTAPTTMHLSPNYTPRGGKGTRFQRCAHTRNAKSCRLSVEIKDMFSVGVFPQGREWAGGKCQCG